MCYDVTKSKNGGEKLNKISKEKEFKQTETTSKVWRIGDGKVAVLHGMDKDPIIYNDSFQGYKEIDINDSVDTDKDVEIIFDDWDEVN